MKINKEENILITGYNGGPVTAKYDDPKIITWLIFVLFY